MTEKIKISDYTYHLSDDRIARYPLSERENSRLLVYDQGKIIHSQFASLPDFFSDDFTLFFNNTKVIPARLFFRKKTGAIIEILLLEPIEPYKEITGAMGIHTPCTWKCMIGNLKKWKDQDVLKAAFALDGMSIEMTAKLINRVEGHVQLSWNVDQPFSTVLEALGKVPLPPYLHRESDAKDKDRYQTVYAKFEGAVAAPTAGLHFTTNVLDILKKKGVKRDELTLHVGAGTFAPVKAEFISDHTMHSEQIIISRSNIQNMRDAIRICAVGTTSLRTLESVYWYAVKLLETEETEFIIKQNEAYLPHSTLPERVTALQAILDYMDQHGVDSLLGRTEIFIYPGYTFRMCEGLITNFHQPGSTLLLLIAAFIGEDWKKIYDEALENGYRFLSYGDSSLLLP